MNDDDADERSAVPRYLRNGGSYRNGHDRLYLESRLRHGATALGSRRRHTLPHRLLAESIGTFCLTFVEAGGAMIAVIDPSMVTSSARAIAAGLVVMAMIYSIGPVSGAHINPAVTLAFATRGVFRWRDVPGYWAAQFAGALGAVLALRLVLGNVAHLGTPAAGYGLAPALAMEIVLTAMLVMVVLGTATHHFVVGPNAAVAVGGVVALAGLFARPISGSAMNPARALAPAVASGALHGAWIYAVGPFAGALLGVGLARLLRGMGRPGGMAAAQGGDG